MSKLSNLKILLVDDEAEIRSQLKEHLIEKGGLVAESGTSSDAFEQILKHDYDVVISDLREANLSGNELIKKVREYNGKTPKMVFMSPFEDVSSTNKDKTGIGTDGLYLKPKNLKDLIDLIVEE